MTDIDTETPTPLISQVEGATYSAVSRFIHVTLNFSGISHQVLHSTVLEGSGIWSRKDGLDTVEGQVKRRTENRMKEKMVEIV